MGAREYYEELDYIKQNKSKIRKWAAKDPWMTPYFQSIRLNAYSRDKIPEKLIDVYLEDAGSAMRAEYDAQKCLLNERLLEYDRNFLGADDGYPSGDGRADASVFDLAPLAGSADYKAGKQKVKTKFKPECTCYPGTAQWKEWQSAVKSVNLKNVILFSVDLEAYEKDNKIITEVGISIYDPRENIQHSVIPVIHTHHICIKESWDLRNGKYVEDTKDHFLLGKSTILCLSHAVVLIQSLIDFYLIPHTPEEHTWNRAFVGHNIQGDLDWLKSIYIKIPENIKIFDTMKLYSNMYGRSPSLKRLLTLCNIPYSYLHNGGNDAYFTLLLLLTLCDIGNRLKLSLDNWKSVREKDAEILREDKKQKAHSSKHSSNHRR